MLMGIDVKEREFLRMSDKEKLALLQDAYNRTKAMKYQAISYLQRVELLPDVELTDRQERLIGLYKMGYLGFKRKEKVNVQNGKE